MRLRPAGRAPASVRRWRACVLVQLGTLAVAGTVLAGQTRAGPHQEGLLLLISLTWVGAAMDAGTALTVAWYG